MLHICTLRAWALHPVYKAEGCAEAAVSVPVSLVVIFNKVMEILDAPGASFSNMHSQEIRIGIYEEILIILFIMLAIGKRGQNNIDSVYLREKTFSKLSTMFMLRKSEFFRRFQLTCLCLQ